MANNANAGYDYRVMTELSLLITRPSASADRFVARLSNDVLQSARVVMSPLLKIVPTGAVPDLSRYTGVIFTSLNAVSLAPEAKGKTAYCVGRSAAQRAKATGWDVALIAHTAEDLIVHLAEMEPQSPLLHLAGRHRRGDVAMRLKALGIKVETETLYDQMLVALSEEAQALLQGKGHVVAPLFSPRTAAHFTEQAQRLHNVTIVAMSDAVAKCCRGKGAADILVAAVPTGQEMLRLVEKALRSTSST